MKTKKEQLDTLELVRADYLKQLAKLERNFTWPAARALRLAALSVNKEYGHVCQENGEGLPINLESLTQLEMKQP